MYNVALVNMPFGGLRLPSLALTQLKAVADERLGGRVRSRIVYANHDFGRFTGVPFYNEVGSMLHHPAGLGEWLFRQAAFPELEDNSAEYFVRYYSQRTPEMDAFRRRVSEVRRQLDGFLEELVRDAGLHEADLVGFTSMFSQNLASFAAARKVKEMNPGAVIVLGGANCEAPMGEELARNAPGIDFVFSGPSLVSFPTLLERLLAGDEEGCHGIDGVFTARNRPLPAAAGAACSGGAAAEVRPFGAERPLDEPVPLDYDSFFASLDEKGLADQVEPYVLFETSRGCWWGQRAHCTFCGLNGSSMTYRSMGPFHAIQQIQSLFRYSRRSNRLECVDNIMPKSYLTEVLPLLDLPPNMGMFYEVRADLGDDDFRAMARARVRWIQPGIEALNTSTLKRMRKGTSAFQNVQFLMSCARWEIMPMWNLLIGFPGEEIDVYEKYLRDLPLLTHLPPPTGAYPVRFDRFSPYFVKAAEYGLQLTPLDFYPLVYPWSGEVLAGMAYYFADRNYAAKYLSNVARMQVKLRDRIEAWRALWREDAPRPELFLDHRGDGWTVVDTRDADGVREHALDEHERLALASLASPKKLAYVAEELAEVDGFDAEAAVASLVARGLVFHEGDRYLSLVFPERILVDPLQPAGDLAGTVAAA